MPKPGRRYLLLDEPLSWLDIRHQFDFLRQVRAFIDERTVVIAVLHDLNLALNFADEVLLIHQGRLFAAGLPDRALSPENIETAYQWKSRRIESEHARLLWKQDQ